MSAVGGVFKLPSHNWLFPEHYNWADGSYKAPDNDKEIATIREFLLGDIADVRLTARQANTAVSMVQTFDHAAANIRGKLTLMEDLADDALNGRHTPKERASMQTRLRQLAADINKITENTQYDDNKLFTANGRTITVALDRDRNINLFAQNLTFNAENVSLTTDPKAALKTIRKARKQVDEYANHLNSKYQILQNAMAPIESRMAGPAKIDPATFQTEVARQLTDYLSSAISDDPYTSSNAQANITPDEALKLLHSQT
jgi:flagellin